MKHRNHVFYETIPGRPSWRYFETEQGSHFSGDPPWNITSHTESQRYHKLPSSTFHFTIVIMFVICTVSYRTTARRSKPMSTCPSDWKNWWLFWSMYDVIIMWCQKKVIWCHFTWRTLHVTIVTWWFGLYIWYIINILSQIVCNTPNHKPN